MPDDITVTVLGAEEVRRGTIALFSDIQKRADLELVDIAAQRADMVNAAVPRVTGRLAASVTSDRLRGVGALAGMGDDVTPYAGWIEYGGTRGREYIPGGRYLVPIAEAAGHTVGRDLERATNDEIRTHRWPPPRTV